MPGRDITDYANYVFRFLPHFALMLLYSVGVGSPDQIFSSLVGVCSVLSSENIVSYFVSLCFTSFVKTVFLFPVGLQSAATPFYFPTFFHSRNLSNF